MKKTVLFVAQHLTIGGVQKSLLAALKALDYEKYDVTLYLRKNRTDLLPFVDERVNVIINDDKHHYYRKPRAVLLQLLIVFFKLLNKKDKAEIYNKKLSQLIVNYSMNYEKKRFFSSEKYDIAIAYVQGYVALFTAECVNADKKFVFFRTSVDEVHSIHNKIIGEFNKVVAIHDKQTDLIKQWYPQTSNRITIVENYSDKEFVEEQSKEFSVGRVENQKIICSCGRFSSVKGFDLAVESAKILKGKNTSFLWYFVGDGPERKRIEALIKQYDLQDNVVITGMQKNPYPYMAACDIYVQPSYEESFGNTMVEAQMLLKPVVTTATLGGNKLVSTGINGIVCPISSEGVAQGIQQLLNNSDLYNTIKNNLEIVDYSNDYLRYKNKWKKLLEE